MSRSSPAIERLSRRPMPTRPSNDTELDSNSRTAEAYRRTSVRSPAVTSSVMMQLSRSNVTVDGVDGLLIPRTHEMLYFTPWFRSRISPVTSFCESSTSSSLLRRPKKRNLFLPCIIRRVTLSSFENMRLKHDWNREGAITENRQ